MSATILQGVDSPCATENMKEVPCDDPLVRSLVKEVARHGQAVIAYVEGTFVTVCCAVTRVVLLARDVGCMPFQWLGHCWGFAVNLAVGNAGGDKVDKHNLRLVNDDRSAVKGLDLRALEEGAHFKPEQLLETAPTSPASAHQQQQLRTLSGGINNTCSITVRILSGHEVDVTAPRITASEVPSSPSSSVTPPSYHSSNTHPSSRPTSGGAIEQNPSTPPLSVGAIENKNSGSGSGSGVNDQPDVTIMPFRLGDGEEEKASSFVPSSIAGSSSSRAGRPVRWSMAYLRDNAEEGCGKIFGMGNFATVAVVTNKTSGVKMAVKSIDMCTEDPELMDETIDMEIKTLQAAGVHPNVVDCFGYLKTSERICIMMPMIPSGLAKLLAKVGPLHEKRAQKFMRQVISAVEYLHSKNILHRDLKPANMLLTEDDTMLLADFGLSTIIPPGETFVSGVRCGTKAYMSPEQVAAEGVLNYTTKVDTWGLGVIAYELLHDKMPFSTVIGAEETNDMTRDKYKGGAAAVPAQVGGLERKYIDSADTQERANISSATYRCDDKLVSQDAKDFIATLLERDVDKRLSASDAAEHPWLGGRDKANQIRTMAAAAVAAREAALSAEKARLAGGRRRGVRRRVTAPVVRTEQGKGVASGVTGGGGEAA